VEADYVEWKWHGSSRVAGGELAFACGVHEVVEKLGSDDPMVFMERTSASGHFGGEIPASGTD
jgi:hypothetical protein